MMTTRNVEDYVKVPVTSRNMMQYLDSISEFPELFKILLTVYGKEKTIPILATPYVFPPSAPFSRTTKLIYDKLQGLEGKSVLDIGTGTGIQAICAALNGATNVVASDISVDAIRCAKCNALLNGLEDKIQFYLSDMFKDLPASKYDVILGNLPIVDMHCDKSQYSSLFDEGLVLHKLLFSEGKRYLNTGGSILLTHADLLGEDDFTKFEDTIRSNDLDFEIINSVTDLGHEWRNYRLFERTNQVII